MNIAIFGLGHVGSVSAACLAAAGHRVVSVDVDQRKLALMASARLGLHGLRPRFEALVLGGMRCLATIG